MVMRAREPIEQAAGPVPFSLQWRAVYRTLARPRHRDAVVWPSWYVAPGLRSDRRVAER